MTRPASALALAFLAGTLVHAQVPAGPEVRIAPSEPSYPPQVSAAPLPDHGFVAVWSVWNSVLSTGLIHGQRFDASGTPVGAEFDVSPTVPAAYGAQVASAADGSFSVVWFGRVWGSTSHVWTRRYDTAGQAGGEFQVSAGPASSYRQDVATDPAGPSLVVYQTFNRLGDPDLTIAARRLGADGIPVGAELRVNTWTTDWQDHPVVAAQGNGEFVVAWDSKLQDGDAYGVYAQRVDASGAMVGGEFRVNDSTTGTQERPAIAADAAGNFVVAWQSTSRDGSGWAAMARVFDRQGNPLTGELLANTFTAGHQAYVSADRAPGGDFVVAWYSGPQGHLGGGFAQRFSASGQRIGGEFRVHTYDQGFQVPLAVVARSADTFTIFWESWPYGVDGPGAYMQRFGGLLPVAVRADTSGNGVLEPGETADFRPSWQNVTGSTQTFAGELVSSDPALLSVPGPSASYGTVADGAVAECSACYTVAVPDPPTRPALHWDGPVTETIVTPGHGQRNDMLAHIGESFTDVATSSPFYRFIETLLHYSITTGCTATAYCPGNATTREQISVFVLVAKEGPGYTPQACAAPVFNDVPPNSPFCRFIEELFRRNVVTGCGGGNYCPTADVSREQMAVFVLRTLDPVLNPPACLPPNIYSDVPETSGFCRWIEELTNRGVVTGCGGGNYCPTDPVTREQMSVFISATFGLTLYGP